MPYSKIGHEDDEAGQRRKTILGSIGLGFLTTAVLVLWAWWPFSGRSLNGTESFSTSSQLLKVGDVKWWPCSGSHSVKMECGYIIVPLDYHNSSAGVSQIALSRMKATTKTRKGTILYNPGGPGSSGKQAILQYGKYLQSAIADKYDWVGFDPRGVGETQPQVRCFKDGDYEDFLAGTVLDRGYDVPPTSNDKIIRDALVAQQRKADTIFQAQFAACKQNMGDTLKYMGTTIVSRDIEFITSTLEGKDALINYYGVSYGTIIGSYLVNMFPERVGRVVIDGVVNPMLWSSDPAYRWYRSWSEDSEATYSLFFSECSRVGPPLCPLAQVQGEIPEKIKDRVQKFLNHLYDEPMSIPELTPPGILNSGRAMIRIYVALQHPLIWRNLSIALGEAMEGNATLLMELGHQMVQKHEGAPPADLQRSAVSCNDQVPYGPLPTPEEVVDEMMETLEHISRFALSVAASERDMGCQFWPVRPPERFAGPFNHTLKNPILIHSNELDPVTPLSGGQLLNRLLPTSSSLVVREGPGHCSFTVPSLCTAKISRDYFQDGTLPRNRQRCPVDVSLFANNITTALSDPDKSLMEDTRSIALYFNHIL